MGIRIMKYNEAVIYCAQKVGGDSTGALQQILALGPPESLIRP